MKSYMPIVKVVVVLAVIVAVSITATAYAKKPKPPDDGCPRDIMCLDVWDPVICDDGQIYSNACYAYRACATGCVPAGGGPVPAVE
ncbi:MAG: hypothetical protein JSU63_06965 [Phycisphaerales bacterium]|nr:MAG: hypothetical protein JSU63_06965 [Phycisphaerales bacterium]